jgi:quinone-modifying oxidoreductase subunit QmoC
MKKGRVNELKLGMSIYFMNGFGEGVKTAFKMKDVGLGMVKTGRMNPMEIVGGHSVNDLSGFQKVVKKAQELEAARIAKHGA